MEGQCLLFVDDDADLLASNKRYFTHIGYTVKTAENALLALEALKSFKPNCIILDVMMPGVDGFSLYKKIRAISSAPILFLSGKTDTGSKIDGLLLGGSDYVTKPYNLKELAARIQVQLRNSHAESSWSSISFPPLTLEIAAHKAFYNKEEIPLSNKEYDFLYLLVSAPGKTVTFEEIGDAIWGYYSEAERSVIMVIASRLRKKLGQYSGLEDVIETVRTKGYTFTGLRRQ